MPVLTFEGKPYPCEPNETALDCLERQGQIMPASCRSGVCQTCLLHAVEGTPPASAQQGLKDTLRAQGYFLACVCKPQEAMTIARPGAEVVSRISARILERASLNQEILRLTLHCLAPFAHRAGQFVQVHREDGLIRSYSIASLPDQEGTLELHVRRLPGGAMSGWLHDAVRPGDTLTLTGPSGTASICQANRNAICCLSGQDRASRRSGASSTTLCSRDIGETSISITAATSRAASIWWTNCGD